MWAPDGLRGLDLAVRRGTRRSTYRYDVFVAPAVLLHRSMQCVIYLARRHHLVTDGTLDWRAGTSEFLPTEVSEKLHCARCGDQLSL
jgi:hypothetical protein